MNEYQLYREGNVLRMKTASFRAEQQSVLHSGIYNRELTSSLAAGAVTILMFMYMIYEGYEFPAIHAALAVGVFAACFVALRMTVFADWHLEAEFRKDEDKAVVTTRQYVKRARTLALSSISGVKVGSRVFAPENPDGVEFVEKISLQHGMYIPGFGEVREFHTVEMALAGGDTVMLFSSLKADSAKELASELADFLGVPVA